MDELPVDVVVGLMLTATAMLAARAFLSLTGQRADGRRRERMLDAVRQIGEDSHVMALLSALAHWTGELGAVERAIVVIRDPDDARAYVVAASYGARDETGRAFAAEAGPVARVVESREPLYDGSSAPAEPVRELALPVIWGGHVRAVLLAGGEGLGQEQVAIVANHVALSARALEHAAARAELERAAQAGVEALAAAVDVRDNYTADHSDGVVELACGVARRLGLGTAAMTEVEFAARLHDVGKIGVPDEILRKPGKLDPEEWSVIRKHTVWGAELLARVPELAAIAPAVRYSHERWDGGGYPDGIAGDDIPLTSRIVSACDAYHAMTSDRPYRPALGVEAARRELTANAGSQFDPLVVDSVIEEIGSQPLPRLV